MKESFVGANLRTATQFVVCLILTLIVTVPNTPVKTQDNKDVRLINNLESYGIRLIGPLDEVFESDMRHYLGSNASKLKPLIEVADSLAVLVKNESRKQVLGISLRWEFVSDDGRTHIFPQGISSPGELMGLVALDPSIRGKTSLLYGSNMRFFSPLQGIESVFVNSGQTVVFPATNYSIDSIGIAKTVSQAQSQKESFYQNMGTCRSVSIDGILFNDGTFVGESKTGFFESISGSIEATKDFLENLRKAAAKSDGLSRAIVEFAEKDLTASREAPGLLVEDKYRLSYMSTMKNIQEQIRRQRSAGLQDNDIAQKEFLSRYTNFVSLKRL